MMPLSHGFPQAPFHQLSLGHSLLISPRFQVASHKLCLERDKGAHWPGKWVRATRRNMMSWRWLFTSQSGFWVKWDKPPNPGLCLWLMALSLEHPCGGLGRRRNHGRGRRTCVFFSLDTWGSRFFPESLDQFFLPKSIMELPATQQE